MSKVLSMRLLVVFFFIGLFSAAAQSPWDNLAKRPSTLDIESGSLSFRTPSFSLKLLKSSQTLSSLVPLGEKDFDYLPVAFLKKRSSDGFYHLGDLNLRFKLAGDSIWQKVSTATKRAPVKALKTSGQVLAAADLTNTLAQNLPLQVIRYWELDGGQLAIRFKLINKSTKQVEIGSLGIPLIFNNILDGQTLDSAHQHNVFYDPYIGGDAGYLQVTRLSGKGPVLLVTPQAKTPFQAYNPLLDDPTPRGITFEGFYEWMPLTKAHQQQEWNKAKAWNPASSIILKPGQEKQFGLKFILAPAIRQIEQTLQQQGRPLAVGFPGYVIPKDVDAKLFLQYKQAIRSIKVFPENALELQAIQSPKLGIKAFAVKGKIWGRARLTIHYADGLEQQVHYKVIKPETDLVNDFGRFLTTEQWYDQKNDIFGRAPSVISYDYETKKQVTQDRRAWVAGLGDEAGSGSWLAAIMKQFVKPDALEVQKMESFVNETLWGKLQSTANDSTKYGVRKSLFYYEPQEMPEGTYSSSINFKTWSAWPKKEAYSIGRSYNYPHVAAAHWVLYRLARYHVGLVNRQKWDWYLENAYQTSIAMVTKAPYYAQFGQMEGSVFLLILKDLKSEGWVKEADSLEAEMKKRSDHWKTLNYPFGSEMPWDSTGQEEVYMWSDYFGYNDKAQVTLNAILGYMPTVPNWGYNGSARRYWDFLYGGKLSRVERQLHHYGSGLNAIPVLKDYRKTGSDMYLLRVGYGGLMGAIANITEDGFGPSAFHAFPSTLAIDGLSGDYGPNFYGYAVNSASYIVRDSQYGWLGFGANLMTKGNLVEATLTTASKNKVFIASKGLWITLDAGKIEALSIDQTSGKVTLTLAASDQFTPVAFIRTESTAGYQKLQLSGNFKQERGAYLVPLIGKSQKLVFE